MSCKTHGSSENGVKSIEAAPKASSTPPLSQFVNSAVPSSQIIRGSWDGEAVDFAA